MRLFFLILIFLPVNNCKVNPKPGHDIIKLTYEVSSRGYYRYIGISKDQITLSDNREMDNILSAEISPERWQSLTAHLKGLDLNKLNSLDASTAESAVDRSLIGELTVKTGENSYISPMFDHNNPPAQLNALITQMMALAETVE